ncbi:MAG: hypothetical protein QF664_05255 [Dehalococcoidia bacterium]|nr:hypothetical protein [Dehalococcoidia bacterium]
MSAGDGGGAGSDGGGGDALRALLAGEVSLVSASSDGAIEVLQPGVPAAGVVLSGSFNPLHDGHVQLAAAAAALEGADASFELSVTNVDKPPLAEAEVRRRIEQFARLDRFAGVPAASGDLLLTRAPTFVEKARLLPGRAFAIGWDTAVRLVHPRYYDGDEQAMLDALSEMRDLGCRVYVAGREHDGAFRTLADVDVPPSVAGLLVAVPEDRFRLDISSTALRDG